MGKLDRTARWFIFRRLVVISMLLACIWYTITGVYDRATLAIAIAIMFEVTKDDL